MANGHGARLDSWKQIASHLDRDVRTVQRWAQRQGLPVYRVAGGRGHSVFAYAAELDAWMTGPDSAGWGDGRPVDAAKPKSRRRRLAIAVVLIASLAVVVILALGYRNSPGPVHSVRVTGTDVSALDAGGRVVWSHREAQPLTVPTSWVGEPDAKGGAAIVVAGEIQNEAQSKGVLAGYSLAGTPLWRITPKDTVRFVGGKYGPPWGTLQSVVYRADGETRIAWSVHHHSWWPSALIVYDGAGHPIDRFVNAGWITRIAVSHDDKRLFAAGINQEHGGVMFAVLDARHPGGSSPSEGDSPFACLDCGPGRPLHYYVLPNPELTGFGDRNPITPWIKVFDSGAVELRVSPRSEALPGAEIIWEFSPSLDIESVGASDVYWQWHRRLETQGQVQHRSDDCPERKAFTAREWTAQSGWRTLSVPALITAKAR